MSNIKYWEEKLKIIKEKGNFKTGHGNNTSNFFSDAFNQEEKEEYINNMIKKCR